MFDRWVIDGTMGYPFCFCPIEVDLKGDYSIVTGMNLIGDKPPNGRVVAIVHQDGQGAVEEFCEKYKDELAAISLWQQLHAPPPALD